MVPLADVMVFVDQVLRNHGLPRLSTGLLVTVRPQNLQVRKPERVAGRHDTDATGQVFPLECPAAEIIVFVTLRRGKSPHERRKVIGPEPELDFTFG